MQHSQFIGSEAARRRYWARAMIGWPNIANAVPNRSHHAIDQLVGGGYVCDIVTQNVDGLQQRAGTLGSFVHELHGSLWNVAQLGCGCKRPRTKFHADLVTANPTFVPMMDAVETTSRAAQREVLRRMLSPFPPKPSDDLPGSADCPPAQGTSATSNDPTPQIWTSRPLRRVGRASVGEIDAAAAVGTVAASDVVQPPPASMEGPLGTSLFTLPSIPSNRASPASTASGAAAGASGGGSTAGGGAATAAADVRPDGDVDATAIPFDAFHVTQCASCGRDAAVSAADGGCIAMPDIVFFGGSLDPTVRSAAHDKVQQASAVVLVGTTVSTHSAFTLCETARKAGIPVFAATVGPTRADPLLAHERFDVHALDFMKALLEELGLEESPQRAAEWGVREGVMSEADISNLTMSTAV